MKGGLPDPLTLADMLWLETELGRRISEMRENTPEAAWQIEALHALRDRVVRTRQMKVDVGLQEDLEAPVDLLPRRRFPPEEMKQPAKRPITSPVYVLPALGALMVIGAVAVLILAAMGYIG